MSGAPWAWAYGDEPVTISGRKYAPEPVEVRAARFGSAHGPLALMVSDGEGAWVKLTVNLAGYGDAGALDPDEVAVKNYAENEGTLDALVRAGIVAPPHRHFRDVDGSRVTFPICRVLVSPRPYP